MRRDHVVTCCSRASSSRHRFASSSACDGLRRLAHRRQPRARALQLGVGHAHGRRLVDGLLERLGVVGGLGCGETLGGGALQACEQLGEV